MNGLHPVPGDEAGDDARVIPTLRDYFAGWALQGMIAGGDGSIAAAVMADDAYHYADAMLRARVQK